MSVKIRFISRGEISNHFSTASKGVFTFTPLNISFNELPVETRFILWGEVLFLGYRAFCKEYNLFFKLFLTVAVSPLNANGWRFLSVRRFLSNCTFILNLSN
jgi:hypothetical protein